MAQNAKEVPKVSQLNRLRLSHIYLYCLKLRKSIQRLERSMELQELEE